MSPKSVLIIEDDRDLLGSLELSLKDAGINPIVASDGLIGVQKCRNQKFDAIVCDIKMPKLDGESAIDQIRKHGPNSSTPVVILSGELDPDLLSRLKPKVSRAFVKPVTSGELVDYLKKISE